MLFAVAVLLATSACGRGASEEPPATAPGAEADNDAMSGEELQLGGSVFARNCASCHGPRGGGGFGPKLADGRVVDRYPDIDDHRQVVVGGRGQMPARGDQLSEEEIDAVVAYEREAL
ncbi:MAG: cytochrome c [Actinomycetota bacterium]|nr:cytochrome c [Actinomycetota bacterium]